MAGEQQPQSGVARLQTPGFPEFERVRKEVEREFEHLVEGSYRLGRSTALFVQHQLFAFEFIDPPFIGSDDAIA
ncbi:hypothetical protein AAJ72_11080 [Citromicrobium sp. RCC1885]|uniref:hypothetical protein n=1 Tax=unclassified Citromicrobium TaxID=2630544 RepID=UPI0006C92138|nr:MULTISPECIES: hypothetical protein [unclassified Citromicrobium]KPM22437.1 hypothetical protein AAJ72_11080 [Citromicrobium sp. RCC1885]KPM25920.1 hypothetical protein AAJ74_11820 [Citromicrobium sp. RCC1878]